MKNKKQFECTIGFEPKDRSAQFYRLDCYGLAKDKPTALCQMLPYMATLEKQKRKVRRWATYEGKGVLKELKALWQAHQAAEINETLSYCCEEHDGYVCTLLKGHKTPHLAAAGPSTFYLIW